jgi:DHA1 family tetracycline resistance protein-like MFS transporter
MISVGVVIAAVQGVGVRRLVPRYGEKRTAVVALVLNGIAAAAALLAPSLVAVFPIILFRNAASGFVFPSLGGLVSKLARDDEQGQLMGVTSALASLMSALGPAAAGAVHERLFSGAGYCLGAVLIGVAALVAGRLRIPARAPTSRAAPRAHPG